MEIALYYIFSDSHGFTNLTNHWMSLLCHTSQVKKYISGIKAYLKRSNLNTEIFETMGQRFEMDLSLDML